MIRKCDLKFFANIMGATEQVALECMIIYLMEEEN